MDERDKSLAEEQAKETAAAAEISAAETEGSEDEIVLPPKRGRGRPPKNPKSQHVPEMIQTMCPMKYRPRRMRQKSRPSHSRMIIRMISMGCGSSQNLSGSRTRHRRE